MTKSKTVRVRNDIDVVSARMQVREAARLIGMNLHDQACISLATSSLANAMHMGCNEQDEIMIESLQEGERRGLRVICRIQGQGVGNGGTKQSEIKSSFWMVDEHDIVDSSEQMQVTLVKWLE